jgi:glycosyltransferase involved in cell wall biosynthesis
MSLKRILIICPYPHDVAPSQRLKYEQYISDWEAKGYQVDLSPFMNLTFWNIVYKKGFLWSKIFWTLIGYFKRTLTLFKLPFYDLVYIHLWVVPFGPPIWERLYSWLQPKIIYDIDDMIFLHASSKVNPFIQYLKGASRINYLLKHSKHNIVCTPVLEEYARKFSSKVTDISSTINTEIYLPKADYNIHHSITIGWSGSHSTLRYACLLEDVFLALEKKFSITILLIGATQNPFKKIQATCLPWKASTEVEDLQKIDIGVYPMPDEPWVYGKSGLKALQYMALGIPTVASALGANYRIISNSVDGYLVSTFAEWEDRLTQLILDKDLRERIGKAGRVKVEETYSVKANRKRYWEIIKGVIES